MPVFFVSYARRDVQHPAFLEQLVVFIEDLKARVAVDLGIDPEDVCFLDQDIAAGTVFSDRIRDALMRCKVGITLYSSNYFSRPWCGREFQILLNRSRPGEGGTGIIPVRWTHKFSPPACAARLQYQDASFPPEYVSRGLQKLVERRSIEPDPYFKALDALTARIVAEAETQRLAHLEDLDFDSVRSAWDCSVEADPHSHTRGNISKTCFVFLSNRGWAWVPYQDTASTIGALAQTIAGDLNLYSEEIKCDDQLLTKLRETKENNVPTLLFADPASISTQPYAKYLSTYDDLYLMNCAALVPWAADVRETVETDQRWAHLKNACPQKIDNPPPGHEWRSVFSSDELRIRTGTLIEQVRSRLMNKLLSDQNHATAPRRAEDTSIAESAAARGIALGSLPNLSGTGQ